MTMMRHSMEGKADGGVWVVEAMPHQPQYGHDQSNEPRMRSMVVLQNLMLKELK
jgi:hypothetical protein